MKDVSATPKVADNPESTNSKTLQKPTDRSNRANHCRLCGEPGFADALREGPSYCADHLPAGATLLQVNQDIRELIAAYRLLSEAEKAFVRGTLATLTDATLTDHESESEVAP